MADNIEVIITSEESPSVIVENVSEVSVIVTEGSQGPKGAQGEAGSTFLSNLNDVESSNLQDGSLLIYKQQTQKWIASTELNNQAIDAGHY